MGAPVVPMADPDDMVAIHRVFRDALAAAPTLVEADAQPLELLAAYFDNVLRLLQVHHDGEDELMTPLLLQRCTPDEAALVEQVAAQHEPVVLGIDAALEAVAAWRTDAGQNTAAALRTVLAELAGPLTEHLDDEERLVLPVVARYLTEDEWGALPGHGMRAFTGDSLWLILGLIRAEMTPEQVARMDTRMPPPLLTWWTGTGAGQYAEFAAGLAAVLHG